MYFFKKTIKMTQVKKNLFYIIIFLFSSCLKDLEKPQLVANPNELKPTADFSLDKNACDAVPCVVTITNKSTKAVAWSWRFDNGTTSDKENPSAVSFTQAKIYNITLIVTGSTGLKDSTSKTVTISISGAKVKASFTTDKASGDAPLAVNFTNTSSNADAYIWNFGDGSSTSSMVSPSHTFAAGDFTVKLFALKNGAIADSMPLLISSKKATIATNLGSLGIGKAIRPTADGGYIIAGTKSEGTKTSGFLLKTDKSGNKLWGPTKIAYSDFDIIEDVVEGADGTFIAVGSSYDAATTKKDALLARCSASGGLSASPILFGAKNNTHDGATCIIETADGGFLIGGYSVNKTSGNNDLLLIKTNASGTITFNQIYVGAFEETATGVVEIAGSGYAIIGTAQKTTDYDIIYLKTDKAGQKETGYPKYISSSKDESAESAKMLNSGEIIIAGSTNNEGAGQEDGYAYKMNTQSSKIWSAPFGAALVDYFNDVTELSNNNLLFVGSKGDFAWILETDKNGKKSGSEIVYNGSGGLLSISEFTSVARATDGGYVALGQKGEVLYFIKN
jgi:PKD repeat protein